MRKSKWYGLDVCVDCEKVFRDNETFWKGVCPFCGSNPIKSKRVSIREVKHYSWWNITNRKKTYEGADSFSKEWLKRKEKV